jgi:transcription termination factor Rho
MTERRRSTRRGRGQSPDDATSTDAISDANPYLDSTPQAPSAPTAPAEPRPEPRSEPREEPRSEPRARAEPSPTVAPAVSLVPRDNGSEGPSSPPDSSAGGGSGPGDGGPAGNDDGGDRAGQGRGRFRRFRHRNRNAQGGGNQQQQPQQQQQHQRQNQNNNQQFSGGRRNNRRNRPQAEAAPRGPVGPIIVEGETSGLFDPQRDAGYLRSASHSYLAEANDPFVPAQLVRQAGLRRGDLVTVTVGRDQRGRVTAAELLTVNGGDPEAALRRPEFASLVASYPDRKLSLETGRPAKAGPELTRRAIDLIAPIGYGQRALIVAPARAGKTMLLQAVIEGIAINQPDVQLFVLLVDERPEEVSDMISIGHGEVVASSFDMPAQRHADVAEMTLERARRLVELGQDVVIVLDSITRLARAYNTIERGTGRTMSGGLDSSAMAKPKAFFGSARSVAPENGGGSLTIIATALVETGSRMDDVIFEEFKGTGNCEIKLDRSLAEKRIFPAIDIGISGTRREDKLFRPDQLDHVYTLRRGLQQMPSSSAMEWLIKRIAATPNNDALLSGL